MRASAVALTTAATPNTDATSAEAAVTGKGAMIASAEVVGLEGETAAADMNVATGVQRKEAKVGTKTAAVNAVRAAGSPRARIGRSAAAQTAGGRATQATISAARRALTLSE